MDLCNKVLSKATINWTDVQKQLLNVIQTRPVSSSSSTSSSSLTSSSTMSAAVLATSSIAINNLFVKQCTDFLIKHIKNINQAQVIDQLENLAKANGLGVFKTPCEEEPSTVNAFLNTDDFYFEVSVNLAGQIVDVKFSIFSETAKSNTLLKEIICAWNWQMLVKHIHGIKESFILNHVDHQTRSKAFKSLQTLEFDLSKLNELQASFVDKFLAKSAKQQPQQQNNHLLSNQKYKRVQMLVNCTPIGVFSKSELGRSMRLFYYLSPLDLIEHQQAQKQHSNTANEKLVNELFKSIDSEQVVSKQMGAFLTICLHSTGSKVAASQSGESASSSSSLSPPATLSENELHKLPDLSLLNLNENDLAACHDHLNAYLNSQLNYEKNPTFKSVTSVNSFVQVPGTFVCKLNKPIVMCWSTLRKLQQSIGIETVSSSELDADGVNKSPTRTFTPFFELLAKTCIHTQILNDAYMVQLPDEHQIYYITELDHPNCMGVVVEHLLFTNPQDLVRIVDTLRKQLMFNELLLSCMRKLCTTSISKDSNNNSFVRIFEIGLLKPLVCSIIMQHPVLPCYTTVEIDASSGHIETRFRDHADLHDANVISELMRRCHSIPVTMRALLNKYKRVKLGSNGAHATHKRPNRTDSNGSNEDGSGHFDTNRHHHHHRRRTHSNRNRMDESQNDDTLNDNEDTNASQLDEANELDDEEEEEDAVFFHDDTDDLQITPQSLSNTANMYSTRRLTPSRSDSYKTPNLSTLSSFLNEEQANRSTLDDEATDKLIKREMMMKKEKLAAMQTSSTKKRKASSSSTSSSSSSNDHMSSSSSTSSSSSSSKSNQPPSAKRKPSQNDLKRHTSLLSDLTKQPQPMPIVVDLSTGSSVPSGKKSKMKNSLSSIDLSNKSPANNNNTSSSNTDQNVKTKLTPTANNKKDILALAMANSQSLEKKKKEVNIQPKSQNHTPSNTASKKHSSLSNSVKLPLQQQQQPQQIKAKTVTSTDESLKRMSKKASQNSTPQQQHSKSNNNLSATEIQLKHREQSFTHTPLVHHSSSTLSISSPLSSIQSYTHSNNRTPSPSFTNSISLTTPSPLSVAESEPSQASGSEQANEQQQFGVVKKETKSKKQDILSLIKPNTPPQSAFAAITFKSNFKIPKTKPDANVSATSTTSNPTTTSNETDDNDLNLNKTPLSSSSPKTISSPSKASTPTPLSSDNNKANNKVNNKPSSTANHPAAMRSTNASPKWNNGNMSPRNGLLDPNGAQSPNANALPNNKQKFHPNNNNNNGNNTFKTNNTNNNQRLQGNNNGQRPVTPIPAQFANSRTSNMNKPLGQVPIPLMTAKIPPLMSFDSMNAMSSMSTNPNSSAPPNDSLTPSSPTESASELSSMKSEQAKQIEKELVKPPDSPLCEQATTFTPKLIPLERDFGVMPCDSMSNQCITSNSALLGSSSSSTYSSSHTSNSSIVQSKLKAKAVDIASPDAVHLDDEEEDGDNLIIDLIQPSKSAQPSMANHELKTNQNLPATFTTRNLNNNNEILSNKAASPASTSSTVHIPSSPRLNSNNLSTKSPLVIEEDCVNDALTS